MKTFSATFAAACGKKLIKEQEFNHGRAKAFLELRAHDEIWALGRVKHHKWEDETEVQIFLPTDLKNALTNAIQTAEFLKAVKIAWHEAAKQDAFFKGVDVCLEDHLLAKRIYNNGQAAAFLEMRNGSELWVYGKFYDPRGNRGPEVKIELNLSPEEKEELLLREGWVKTMSPEVQKIVLQAWKQASEKDSFFRGLIA